MSGFQSRMNTDLPIGVEGDFASQNPRTNLLNATEAGFIAGALGVRTGQFAWIAADGKTLVNYGVGAKAPDCFIGGPAFQASITLYLAEDSRRILPGQPVTGFNEGDFLDLIEAGSASFLGADCYASYTDGSLSIGSAPAGASATGAMGATFTATGASTNLTVTSVTGLISIGDTISGTGVPAGTKIVSQTSGTTGGAGVYVTSAATTASAATVTAFGSVLNVTAVASGLLKVGSPVSGTGIPANATIASQVSGATGGVGVYTLNTPATAYAASTALTVVGGVLTRFKARSVAAVGELVKISTWGA